MTDARPIWQPDYVDQRLWWSWLAGKLGCDPALTRPFLFCIRGVSPLALATHENVARPGYNDTGVLVFRGGEVVFPMSSVPYQTNSKASPDVNGDGVGDVGCIKPGLYRLEDRGSQPYPIFVVALPDGSEKIPCSRDLKHDGRIDHEGPEIYAATAVLVHTGLDGLQLSPPSAHTSSIACQTANVKWLRLMREKMAAQGSGVADYRLVDADAVVEIMKTCPYLKSDAPENVT